jgi:CheY-like chemotaxis protein
MSLGTIVYVEDDEDDASIMKEIFETIENAPPIYTCKDGKVALSYLRENDNVCFVLIDINMPGMDGKALVTNIKEMPSLKSLPLAFLSTSRSPHDHDLALSLGMHFFVKPNSIDGLTVLAKQIIQFANG